MMYESDLLNSMSDETSSRIKHYDVNTSITELLISIYACKTLYAKSITVILPYLPYSKQCRAQRRSAIPMKLIADMICRAGATSLFSLDLYRKEIQGFFSIPVDNLRASPFLLTYIRNRIPDYRNAVIVAKSPDFMHKATSYADRLRLSVAVIHGEAKQGDCQVEEDGRQSPPLENYPADGEQQESSTSTLEKYKLFPRQTVKEKTSLTVIGDMDGRIAIIVDDIIDEAQSFVDAAEVVVTNSVPHDMQKLRCHKICTVDVSLVISEAIRRIYNGESMGQLFRGVTLND